MVGDALTSSAGAVGGGEGGGYGEAMGEGRGGGIGCSSIDWGHVVRITHRYVLTTRWQRTKKVYSEEVQIAQV